MSDCDKCGETEPKLSAVCELRNMKGWSGECHLGTEAEKPEKTFDKKRRKK
jgi:hypothetical protein